MQNQMFILRGVLKVKFTKYCTCAAKNPAQPGEFSWEWTGFSYLTGVGTLYARGIFREQGGENTCGTIGGWLVRRWAGAPTPNNGYHTE